MRSLIQRGARRFEEMLGADQATPVALLTRGRRSHVAPQRVEDKTVDGVWRIGESLGQVGVVPGVIRGLAIDHVGGRRADSTVRLAGLTRELRLPHGRDEDADVERLAASTGASSARLVGLVFQAAQTAEEERNRRRDARAPTHQG